MKYLNEEKYFKKCSHCSVSEKNDFYSLFIDPIDELYDYIFSPNEDILSEIFRTSSGVLIGGYIAKKIQPHKLIQLIDFVMAPDFRSRIYTRYLMNRIIHLGSQLYNENFKGIIATCKCTKYQKNKDIQLYKSRSLFNVGGKLIFECAKIKNNHLHLVYVPYDGDYDYEYIKEVFQKIYIF